MIVNIRGTSGSGKSTLMRLLMEAHGGKVPWMGPDPTATTSKERILGYVTGDGNIGVPGRYETDCGGCDSIKTQDEAQRRVAELAQHHPHVVFEGLLISHIYGRWAEMADEYPDQWAFAFLDTPLDTCVARVAERRARKGNFKEFDTTNTVQKWHDSLRVSAKARADGHRVVVLPWQDPLPALEALLK